MASDDRFVGVCVDAERHADENALDAGRSGTLGLVGRIQHHGSILGGGGTMERFVLVVAVDDELGTGKSGGACECELARRCDVGADPLLAQET
jgi:hypothetical protein